MSARTKLNAAFGSRSLLVAVAAGWLMQSWRSFCVALAALRVPTSTSRRSERGGVTGACRRSVEAHRPPAEQERRAEQRPTPVPVGGTLGLAIPCAILVKSSWLVWIPAVAALVAVGRLGSATPRR